MAVDQYVRDVIGSTRALSTPFIEKPSEINASPIYASAFHPSLLPARGDESYQAKLIQEELIAKGGIGDDEIDKNTIMFYQSYYGLVSQLAFQVCSAPSFRNLSAKWRRIFQCVF